MRFTTFATAFAIAGLTAGGVYAQGSPSPGASPAQPPGAAQSGAYCLEGSAGKTCSFATMAACEAAKKGAADKCSPNPAATTGSGAAGSPAKPPGSPSPSR